MGACSGGCAALLAPLTSQINPRAYLRVRSQNGCLRASDGLNRLAGSSMRAFSRRSCPHRGHSASDAHDELGARLVIGA